MNNTRQYLKNGHALKEIMIDVDSQCWWIAGMASVYPLTFDERQQLKGDHEDAVFAIVSKEFPNLDRKNIVFKKQPA